MVELTLTYLMPHIEFLMHKIVQGKLSVIADTGQVRRSNIMSDIKQRPVIYGGNVSGHAVVTIELRYEYDLEDLQWLNLEGEIGDTEEDLEDQLNSEIESYLASTIERDMEDLGYNHAEPEVICATDTKVLDYTLADFEIEIEDVEDITYPEETVDA
jgi:hypothetical protein